MRYKEIYNQILSMVKDGTIGPKSRIFSDMELCARFNVSRTVARRVLSKLTEDGVIYRKKKAGSFVALKNETADSIAVMLPGEQYNDFKVLDSIMESNVEFGYLIDVFHTELNTEKEREILENLSSKYKGVIFLPTSTSENVEQISRLLISGVPVVLLDIAISGLNIPCVTSDNFYGFYSLVEHLLEEGHTKIAFIELHDAINDAEKERYKGYCHALIHNKIPVKKDFVFTSDILGKAFYLLSEEEQSVLVERNAEEDYEKYRAMDDKPTALCFVNDISAGAVLKAVNRRGEELPQGTVVTGFDNLSISRELNFTTVSQDFAAIGKKALKVLHAAIGGKETAKNNPIKTKLYLRN